VDLLSFIVWRSSHANEIWIMLLKNEIFGIRYADRPTLGTAESSYACYQGPRLDVSTEWHDLHDKKKKNRRTSPNRSNKSWPIRRPSVLGFFFTFPIFVPGLSYQGSLIGNHISWLKIRCDCIEVEAIKKKKSIDPSSLSRDTFQSYKISTCTCPCLRASRPNVPKLYYENGEEKLSRGFLNAMIFYMFPRVAQWTNSPKPACKPTFPYILMYLIEPAHGRNHSTRFYPFRSW
jgi:hypothetical protein